VLPVVEIQFKWIFADNRSLYETTYAHIPFHYPIACELKDTFGIRRPQIESLLL